MGSSSLLVFPFLLVLLFLGFPVAFSMMATAFVFGVWTFGWAFVFQVAEKIEDVASNFVLAAVPLFVFMGAMLERSGIANRLFEAIHLWTRRLPGGLAIGTVLMCIIFAASSGVVGATETVIGLLAARYDFPENVRLVDLGTPGLDLHPHLQDLGAAILIDTVRSSGAPGDVRLYRRDEILRHAPMPRVGPHDPGLKEALLALEFAGEGPEELLLVGVIPESTSGGIGLSPPVESALAGVQSSVLARSGY